MLDGTPDVAKFAADLEAVCVETVESGKMTKDLARSIYGESEPPAESWLDTESFLNLLAENMKKKRGAA
jgi:isocitrate dehydrogenase